MMDSGELSLEEIREFLKASGGIRFRGQDREEIYGWLAGLLCGHEYWMRKKEEQGLLRQYVEKVSGMSRA